MSTLPATLQEAGKGEREPVHFDPFPDLPADFGPEVPDEGIDGLLLVGSQQLRMTHWGSWLRSNSPSTQALLVCCLRTDLPAAAGAVAGSVLAQWGLL